MITKKDKAYSIMKEIEEKPFGRWANTTIEARKKASDIMKRIWKERRKR